MNERTALILIGCVILILCCVLALAVTLLFVVTDWLEQLQNELLGPPVRSADIRFSDACCQVGLDLGAGSPD